MLEHPATQAPTEAIDNGDLITATHAVMRFRGYTNTQIAEAAAHAHTPACTWNDPTWTCATDGTPHHPDTDELNAITATLRIGLAHTLAQATARENTLATIAEHATHLAHVASRNESQGAVYGDAATTRIEHATAAITAALEGTPAPAPSPKDTPTGRLARIRARHNATTPGPWTARICAGVDDDPNHGGHGDGIWSTGEADDVLIDEVYLSSANALFIAEAHQDIPYLLNAVETANAKLAQLRAETLALEARAKALTSPAGRRSSRDIVRAIGHAEGILEAVKVLNAALPAADEDTSGTPSDNDH